MKFLQHIGPPLAIIFGKTSLSGSSSLVQLWCGQLGAFIGRSDKEAFIGQIKTSK